MTYRLAVLLVLAAAPAFAQAPGELMPSPLPNPITEQPADLAHIYQRKPVNVSTNPLGMMFGFYGLSIERALNQNVAIHVDGDLWNNDNARIQGVQGRASVAIYFFRTYLGPFIEPGVVYRSSQSHPSCGDCTTGMDRTWAGPVVLAGFHWSFDSGLNIAIALGGAKAVASGGLENGTELDGYFRVGLAF